MAPQTRAAQLWYTPEQYAEVKAMMEDAHLLPDAYAAWQEGAEQREQDARSNGAVVFRVPFDPAEFRRFCLRFRVPLNANTRAQFAALKASQINHDSH